MTKQIIPNLNVGDKVDRLTIIEILPPSFEDKIPRKAKCLCICGNICVKRYHDIRYGKIHSCGCLRNETWESHGGAYTREYNTWLNMKKRCLNKNSSDYKYYGGRGITICNRWMSFKNFYMDMGKRPTPKHTLDRINNDGNYEPRNCRWATRSMQSYNQRKPIKAKKVKCIKCKREFKSPRKCLNSVKHCSWMCRHGKPHPNKKDQHESAKEG